MPMLNNLELPKLFLTRLNNCCSFPTAPSVIKTIILILFSSWGIFIANSKGRAISVPPPALSILIYFIASFLFSEVASIVL